MYLLIIIVIGDMRNYYCIIVTRRPYIEVGMYSYNMHESL
jgi:hypothetical protein